LCVCARACLCVCVCVFFESFVLRPKECSLLFSVLFISFQLKEESVCVFSRALFFFFLNFFMRYFILRQRSVVLFLLLLPERLRLCTCVFVCDTGRISSSLLRFYFLISHRCVICS
jgi:hypothetical protein